MNSTNSLNGITFNGITLTAPPIHRQEEILTPEALDFIAALNRTTTARRADLLAARQTRRSQILSGSDPRYLRETSAIREDPRWRVAPPAPGLEDRRVEITGPVDRKMTINALNSGAKVWLADMEDSSTPTWGNVIRGQLNLIDALERRIDFTSPKARSTSWRPPRSCPPSWSVPAAGTCRKSTC